MQILTFVTVTIMVMTIITYARLEHFLDFKVLAAHYQPFMEKSQRLDFNSKQIYNYENDSLTQKETKKDTVPHTTAKLSFDLILREKSRSKGDPNSLPQHLMIAKELMLNLYKGQPFFEAAENNPGMIDQLLDELMAQADDRDKPISHLRELEKIKLPNPDLDKIYYHMIQGTATEEDEKAKAKEVPPEEKATDEEEEVKFAKDGYKSFLDFITLKPGPKIRMYLTPREILEAIYGKDSQIVDELIAYRQEAYQDIVNGTISAEVAAQGFKDKFLKEVPGWVSEEILDFSVTKTSPKNFQQKNKKKV